MKLNENIRNFFRDRGYVSVREFIANNVGSDVTDLLRSACERDFIDMNNPSSGLYDVDYLIMKLSIFDFGK